jgi:NADH-quinone oxidoreductase subunit J
MVATRARVSRVLPLAPVPSILSPPSKTFAGTHLDQVINQAILFLLLALGGVGVCVALPRRGLNPQPIGAILAGAAAGLIVLIMSLKARAYLPNIYFYIFSAIALSAALKVITHKRPVYAALYFILTVLASAGLFVILSAEFLAFALIIVYAGAILITYLFVIMLATQSPAEEEIEVLADYDVEAREPISGTVAGFVLLAVLTSMMFRGVSELPAPGVAPENALVDFMPGKKNAATLEEQKVTNIESVGFSLLAEHPGAIEIAGVVLLMAMLGAVVLARKQVQLDEEAKARHAASLGAEVRRSEGLA